ncbi:lipase 3-like isoform X2 [Phymastichus coffea]|uniref:lipase 3-like isoform X2 n=1 Tax=Phymastichus coffea TaxID=108790 RepID=UPI00273C7308|nr:lipase 3-like isoform X2 [Phymastichus coffea]
MRFASCMVLIFTLNLHTIPGDSLFRDFAFRTKAVSGDYQANGNNVLLQNQSATDVTLLELITQANYSVEIHHVTTEDQYILTVFRLPGPPGSTPVFLQHGLLESSVDWLLPGKGRSLAYILSNHGYDVWLGNARGSTYSRKHKTLSTSDPKFWDFSWDELGMYDLPAVITYITDLKKDSLFYIGHSMGATTFSVMAIERPEVAKKVKAMIGLAPATYVYYIRASIKLIAPFWKLFQHVSNALGIYEFFPHSLFFDNFARSICKTTSLRNVLCSNPLFLIAGFNPEKLNYPLLPKIWSSFPAGTSVKLFTHWLQQIVVNDLRKFDYGLPTNLKIYNKTEPPVYDISKVQVPVALLWSTNDWMWRNFIAKFL